MTLIVVAQGIGMTLIDVVQGTGMILIDVVQGIEMILIVVVQGIGMTLIDVVQGIEMILIDVVQEIGMILIVVAHGIGMTLIDVGHGIGMTLIDVAHGIGVTLSFHEVGVMRSMGHLVEEEGRGDEMRIGGSQLQRESRQTGGMTEKGKGPGGRWMRRGHGGEMTRIGRGDQGGVGRMSVGGGMLIVIGVELNLMEDGRRGQGEVAEVESRHLHSPLARSWTRRWMRRVLSWW